MLKPSMFKTKSNTFAADWILHNYRKTDLICEWKENSFQLCIWVFHPNPRWFAVRSLVKPYLFFPSLPPKSLCYYFSTWWWIGSFQASAVVKKQSRLQTQPPNLHLRQESKVSITQQLLNDTRCFVSIFRYSAEMVMRPHCIILMF
jgi:hypothetical protein